MSGGRVSWVSDSEPIGNFQGLFQWKKRELFTDIERAAKYVVDEKALELQVAETLMHASGF
jgi:phage gp45-like